MKDGKLNKVITQKLRHPLIAEKNFFGIINTTERRSFVNLFFLWAFFPTRGAHNKFSSHPSKYFGLTVEQSITIRAVLIQFCMVQGRLYCWGFFLGILSSFTWKSPNWIWTWYLRYLMQVISIISIKMYSL